MLGWVIWDPPAISKKPSSNVLSDINTSLKKRISTKTRNLFARTKQSSSFVPESPVRPTDETMFSFCFTHKKAKQYVLLTRKYGRRHYELGCVIQLPSWVSQIILLNKSWLYQEVIITSGHQQFQQLGQPLRCQSKYILLGVGNTKESIQLIQDLHSTIWSITRNLEEAAWLFTLGSQRNSGTFHSKSNWWWRYRFTSLFKDSYLDVEPKYWHSHQTTESS